MTADDYYCQDSLDGTQVTACGKLYHRSLFASLRYPAGKLHEDEFTTYRAVYDAGTVAVVPEKLYAYYYNPDSITQSVWKPGRMDALEAFHQQMEFAKDTGNQRLLERVTDSYVWCIGHQTRQLSNQGRLDAECRRYLNMLRGMLKKILKDGINGRTYPFNRKNLQLYEEVYLAKPFWKALHGVYGLFKKCRNQG